MFYSPRYKHVHEFKKTRSSTVQNLAVPLRKMVGMILAGQMQSQEKTAINEPFYTLDNPNPLRRPDVDLIDIYNHGKMLSDRYQQAIKEYNSLIKSYNDAKASPPTQKIENVE